MARTTSLPDSRLARVVISVAMMAALVACTGTKPEKTAGPTTTSAGDGASSAGASTTTPAATTAAAAAPTTTTVPPTTTVPEAPVVERSIPNDVGEGYAATVTGTLSAYESGQKALIVGTRQFSLGATSDADASIVDENGKTTGVKVPLPPGTVSSSVEAITRAESGPVLFGMANAETARPAVWVSTDGGSKLPLPEFPFDAQTIANAKAIGTIPGGVIVVARSVLPDGYGIVVATRNTSGAWKQATVPNVTGIPVISGVASSGDRVVITGAIMVNGRTTARIWESTDRGLTFAESPSPAIAKATKLGSVYGDAEGFTATACVTGDDADTSGLLHQPASGDWSITVLTVADRDGSATQRPTIRGGGCEHLTRTTDGKFMIGVVDVSAKMIYTTRNGSSTGLIVDVPRLPGHVSEVPPLGLVVGGNQFVLARESLGFTLSRESPLVTSEPPPSKYVTLGQVRPSISAVSITKLSGDAVVSLQTYPHVRETTTSYYWEGVSNVALIKDGGETVATSSAEDLPPGADGFSSDGTTDVAWLIVDDPADGRQGGSSGGTEVFQRTAKGPWTSSGLVGSGAGGEVIGDIRKIPSGWVAVGISYFYGAEGATQRGLLKESADGVTWTEATLLNKPTGDFVLEKLCAGPAAPPLLIGASRGPGTDSIPLIASRLPDGNWQVLSNPLKSGAELITCISDASGIQIWTNEDLKTAVYVSKDGNAFTRSDVVFDDATHSGLGTISAGPKGYVAVGSKNVKGLGQVAVRTSSDGLTWQELPIKPKEPNAPDRSVYGALVVGTTLHVVVDDRGVAKLWSIKLS
jgi:hypothetical protein